MKTKWAFRMWLLFMTIMTLGTISNIAVISANGGWMPIGHPVGERDGIYFKNPSAVWGYYRKPKPQNFFNNTLFPDRDDTLLIWDSQKIPRLYALADVIEWSNGSKKSSIGDCLIITGMVGVIIFTIAVIKAKDPEGSSANT